jgi:hypothetical protein
MAEVKETTWSLKKDSEPVDAKEEIPEGDETSDTAAILGLLTASCQMLQKEKRDECWKKIIPLHRGEKKAKEALKEHLRAFKDEDGIKKAKDRLIWLIEEASKEVEEQSKGEQASLNT